MTTKPTCQTFRGSKRMVRIEDKGDKGVGVGDFSIGVAAHPEPHPHSPSLEEDRRHTAAKLAAADFAITQFFFDARHYFGLVEDLRALGVDKPVIPGIMPATSIRSITRMAELQGSEFPTALAAKLEAAEPDARPIRQ